MQWLYALVAQQDLFKTKKTNVYFLIYFCLCWVFLAVGFSLVLASKGHSLWCVSFSLQQLLLLRLPRSRAQAQ